MRQPQDLVWNAITASARRRFDYDVFKHSLSGSDDDRIADYILFQLIAGYAEELSEDEFNTKLHSDLHLFGYSLSDPELNEILAGKRELLALEIATAKEALSGFSQGHDLHEMLIEVERKLA